LSELLAFAAVLLVVLGGIHLYLWKRLVRDTTSAGAWRRIGTGLLAVLLVLPILTLVGGQPVPEPLRWACYVWVGVMFYLLVVLLVLELPRVAVWIGRRRSGGGIPAGGCSCPARWPVRRWCCRPAPPSSGW